MVEGLKAAVADPVLRALMGATATHRFFGNFIGTIYWLFLVRDLGLTPAFVGLSIGVGGVGAFLGTLAAGRVTRRFGQGHTLIGSLIIVASFSFPLLLPLEKMPSTWVMALIFAMQLCGDIFWSIFFINIVSLKQAVIPAHLLGQLNASLDFAGEGASPLGALVGGLLATLVGSHVTWLVGAGGILAASLWLIFSPVRKIK